MWVTLSSKGVLQDPIETPGRWIHSISNATYTFNAVIDGTAVSGVANVTTEGYRDFKTGVTWQKRTWVIDDLSGNTITLAIDVKGQMKGWCGKYLPGTLAPYCTATTYNPNCNWYITDGTGIYEDLRGYGKTDSGSGVHGGTGYYITD